MGLLLWLAYQNACGDKSGYADLLPHYFNNYFAALHNVGVPTKEMAIGFYEMEKIRVAKLIKANREQDEAEERERQAGEQQEARREARVQRKARKEAYDNMVRAYGKELTDKVGIDPGTFTFKLRDSTYVGG